MVYMRHLRILLVLVFISVASGLAAQQGFTDETRAIYILDISRYVLFNDSTHDREQFIITVLDDDSNLYFELDKQAKTRKRIQGGCVPTLRTCSRDRWFL